MLRRIFALAGLSIGTFFVSPVLFFAFPAQAKNICSCTCFDSQETTSLLREGTDLASCKANVCPTACTEINSTQVEDETDFNPSTNQCVCACQITVKKLQYTNLTAGKTECLGDCSTKCGGQANVIQDSTTPKIVDAQCVPGNAADCKIGAYAQYEGVACVLRPDSDTVKWPNGKPACILPINPKNANLECKNQGGIAKGGTCGFIGSGESPDSYYKSRPFFKTDGTYDVKNYTASIASLGDWTSLLDNEWRSKFPADPPPSIAKDIPAGAGICYQLGAIYGGLPTYSGYTPPEGGAGAVPENDYVCLKKKTDLCGHIDPPANYPVRTPARMFRCQLSVDYTAPYTTDDGKRTALDSCLTAEGACVQPGYICCPSRKPGSCLFDNECSLDKTKICYKPEGVDFLEYGTCVWNPICDPAPEHNQNPALVDPAAPWLTDIRRCRAATPMEIADKEICSDEVPESIGPQRCPGSGQACCRPQNTAALSSCAADKTSGAGPDSVWNNFACMDETALPASEYVDMPDGRKLQTLVETDTGYTGGNCLPPASVKSGGGSQPRCPTGKLCCNTQAIGGYTGTVAQKEKNAECGNVEGTVLRCYEKLALGPTSDEAAQERGFVNADQYFEQIARSSYCTVTPIEPGGSIYQNQECQKELLCCSLRISQGFPCDPEDPDADTVCSQYAPQCDTKPETCLKCDPELKLCVDANLLDKSAASESCFVRSQAYGDEGASEIGKINNDPAGDTFSCQFISPETPGIEQKCVGFGCDDFQTGVPEGKSAACCIPGVGETAAAAAQGAAAPVAIKSAPYSLELPACITAGNCTLDDIVRTGANFANFLIGISGSVFLAIFVYGGFMYLTAGSSERAAKGKKMIIQATLAMVLIMGAFIFVSFIQSSLVGGATGSKEKAACGQTEETQGYACTFLKTPIEKKKEFDAEVGERQCVKKMCPGPANYLCCPS